MKCRACGFDSDEAREEDGFVHLVGKGDLDGVFPQHEAPDVRDGVLLFACPRCGTARIESWRLREDRIGD